MSPWLLQSLRVVIAPAQRGLWLAGLVLTSCLWLVFGIQPASLEGISVGIPSPVTVQASRRVTYVSDVLTMQAQESAANAPTLIKTRTDVYKIPLLRNQLVTLLDSIEQVRNSRDPWKNRVENIDALDENTLEVALIPFETARWLADLPNSKWDKLRTQILTIYDQSMIDVGNRIDVKVVQTLRESTIPNYIDTAADDATRDVILRFITPYVQVNLTIDEEATLQAQADARARVTPVTVSIQQGENIVRAGDVITPLIQEKLKAVGVLTPQQTWLQVIGQGVIAALLALFFTMALWHVDRNAATRRAELWALVVLMVATIFLTRIGVGIWPNLVAASPIVMAALLVSTYYGLRSAIITTITMGCAILLIANGSVLQAIPPFMAALFGSILTRRVDRSQDFLKAGGVAMVVGALTAFGLLLMLERTAEWHSVWPLIVTSGIGALISSLLALSLCGLYGNLAGMVSGLQLLELAHPNQPLLQRLVREAPGTYYHSIAVGNLAESAAEAINADGLLLRVASYYHDIGKVKHPFYFTDNQSDGVNLHDALEPQESARIIIDHVRDGVQMAREARLPTKLIEFIATHHGTTLVRYFYNKARETNPAVDAADYTYPGPNPHTREQVIMMLADGVEATVRSKIQSGAAVSKEGATVESIVNSIIDERLQSGQLAHSQVTLHDISRIRDAFITTLKGIHHSRIDYTPATPHPNGEPVVEPQGHI
ncbi:MAG: HD family phosphohydrolase [Roseiflexaceae bacterium]|jgi:putative nucleotidyltransferase with HDIG domain